MKKSYLLAPAMLLAVCAQQSASAQFAFQASRGPSTTESRDLTPLTSVDVSTLIKEEPLIIRGAFRGFVRQRQHQLTWTTQVQAQLHSVELQYSKDGIQFELLESVPTASLEDHERMLTFINEHPVNGLNYYRLRIEHIDGREAYSQVVTLEASVKPLTILYAGSNPFYEMVRLEIESQHAGVASFRLLDAQGKTVLRGKQDMEAGKNEVKLQGLDRLRPGKYTFDMRMGEFGVTRVLQKAK